MLKSIYKIKLGTKIKFGKHKHWVLNEFIDCTGMIGTIIENDGLTKKHNYVIVDLENPKHQIKLRDWENCLVFTGEEMYKDVKVEEIPTKRVFP